MHLLDIMLRHAVPPTAAIMAAITTKAIMVTRAPRSVSLSAANTPNAMVL
jgi:hypothetical protein